MKKQEQLKIIGIDVKESIRKIGLALCLVLLAAFVAIILFGSERATQATFTMLFLLLPVVLIACIIKLSKPKSNG